MIFASERVSRDAIDYLRFPEPRQLWHELDRQCRAEDGCRAIAIPHNTNMGDGRSFDVETESPDVLSTRARYERLVEVYQEKGNSECLPAFGQTDEDCGFEVRLTRRSQPARPDLFDRDEWQRMRGSYVRRLLLRGLHGYAASAEQRLNPLQLGIIGSTDNHAATGGFVDEAAWQGSVFGVGDFERTMSRLDWSPGGLVAAWAEENTRASLFEALHRREVYATSGPRIRVRFAAADTPLDCDAAPTGRSVPMGGRLTDADGPPAFLVHALYDTTPLQKLEIVKGEYRDGQLREHVIDLWTGADGALDVCRVWADPDFDAAAPAFWYARVLEAPTPRWSAHHCRRAGRCKDYPDAAVAVRERAWTSPIWYLPGG